MPESAFGRDRLMELMGETSGDLGPGHALEEREAGDRLAALPPWHFDHLYHGTQSAHLLEDAPLVCPPGHINNARAVINELEHSEPVDWVSHNAERLDSSSYASNLPAGIIENDLGYEEQWAGDLHMFSGIGPWNESSFWGGQPDLREYAPAVSFAGFGTFNEPPFGGDQPLTGEAPALPSLGFLDATTAQRPLESIDAATPPSSHPAVTTPSTAVPRYPCPLRCGKDFAKKYDADRHARKHRGKHLVCGTDGCEMAFYRRDKLMDHRRNKHKNAIE